MKTTLSLLLFCSLAAGAATLTFPPAATVSGAEIRLADVAVIADAGDELPRLQQVVLGAAPYPGQARTLTLAMIRVRLRQFGIDPETQVITGPEMVRIERASTSLPGETLVETALAWLQPQLPAAPGEEIALTPVHTPTALTIPDGTLAITCEGAGTPVGTLRHVNVLVTVDGRQLWRGLISFRLCRTAEVLVTRTAVTRGAQPGEADVTRERRDIAALADALRDPADLDGLRLAQSLPAGAVLTRAALEVLPLVKKNALVHVTAHCGDLVIVTEALALQDGAAGTVIRVRNTDTKQDFSARVLSAGECELLL